MTAIEQDGASTEIRRWCPYSMITFYTKQIKNKVHILLKKEKKKFKTFHAPTAYDLPKHTSDYLGLPITSLAKWRFEDAQAITYNTICCFYAIPCFNIITGLF